MGALSSAGVYTGLDQFSDLPTAINNKHMKLTCRPYEIIQVRPTGLELALIAAILAILDSV